MVAGGGTPFPIQATIPGFRRIASEEAANVVHFEYVRWDKSSRRKQLEVSCVLPFNKEAVDRAKAFLRQLDHRQIQFPTAPGALGLIVWEDTVRPRWNGDPIDCWRWNNDPGTVYCEGQACSEAFALKAGWNQLANMDLYYCPNGCQVYASPWSYWCDGGGGGGGSGPVYGDEWEGSGSSSGGEQSCPNAEPNCLLPLSAGDRARIDSAFATIDRSREVCDSAFVKVMELWGTNRVYRGNPEIPDGSSDHDAQSRWGSDGFMHIDQGFLRSASIRSLAGVLLHEGWHGAGYATHNPTLPYQNHPWTEQWSCTSQTNY